MVHMAVIQPSVEISNWVKGAKTNCPRLPPAFTKPEAKDLFSGGTRCATWPMSTAKLPAPAPAAVSTPKVTSTAHSLLAKGVSA